MKNVLHRHKRIALGECYLVEGAFLQECLDLVRNVPTLLKKKYHHELWYYEKLKLPFFVLQKKSINYGKDWVV